MENKKVVLVPTDFSDVCLNAINYGANLAGLLGHSLVILHIIDKKTKSELKKLDLSFTAVNNKLDSLVKKTAANYSIEVSSLSREGDIFTAIPEIAKEISASLIILGTHGKTNLQQKISGSYAKKLIVSSWRPAIVVQKNSKFDKELKNIVFPVSTTAEVRQKVKWAVMIAEAFKSKIHLFQLYQPLEEDKMKVNVIVSQIVDEFDKHNIEHTLVTAKKSENFGKQVMTYANENKADLISIMINPDKSNLALNSYDEKMIFNQYEIPVMCVNPFETTVKHWF
jgi:nucleotide-binding universal stress UspA family protein